ncbi:hypothetical protein QF027_006554 [Streptomyces canus]|nr:hypothetical protein [Streptomyces canus]
MREASRGPDAGQGSEPCSTGVTDFGLWLHNRIDPFISTALAVFIDELAHRSRHIELAGEPRRNASHDVWGYASLPVPLSERADHA